MKNNIICWEHYGIHAKWGENWTGYLIQGKRVTGGICINHGKIFVLINDCSGIKFSKTNFISQKVKTFEDAISILINYRDELLSILEK